MNKIITNINARFSAKKYNISERKLDPFRKADSFMSGDWQAADGYLYYGHPLGIFFKSNNNNSWFKPKNK